MRSTLLAVLFGGLVLSSALGQTPMSSEFSYQGQIKQAGAALDGSVDLEFTIWDAATNGLAVSTTLTASDVAVVDGLFTVDLDFGAAPFAGDARWLEIAVRSPHDPTDTAAFTTLTPRQPLSAAPYAVHALNAGQWANSGNAIMNTNSGFVGVNRDYAVGSEWFGVHAPSGEGAYGGMYVTTDTTTGKPFYGYHTGGEKGWHYLDGETGDWHLYLETERLTVTDEGDVGIGTTTPDHRLHVRSFSDKAVVAEATHPSDPTVAVYGSSASSNGFAYGVQGEITNASGAGVGVYGEAPFYGVMGRANDNGVAVLGLSEGIGSYGEGQTGEGVLGVTYSSNTQVAGVTGYGDNRGVFGQAQSSTGEVSGVYGKSSSPNGRGVYGENTSSGGFAYGVYGELTNPASTGVAVYGKAPFYGVTGEATGAGVGVIGRSSLGVYGESNSTGGTGVMGAANASSGTNYGVYGISNSSSGYAGYFQGRGFFDGYVGVGTTPSYRFHVDDSLASTNVLHVERSADATSSSDLVELEMGLGSQATTQFIECQWSNNDVKFRVWADGDVSADGVFTAGGADFAEMVRVSAGADSVEPGDVMVIDPTDTRAFLKSKSKRSTLVAGIYSTEPGVLGSEHDWDQLALDLLPGEGENGEPAAIRSMELGRMIDEIPLAVVGIVPCKVSAENGPIRAGDLLVTSGTPGHAMRDDDARAGTIVGKALGALDEGTGVIKVLVTLQ